MIATFPESLYRGLRKSEWLIDGPHGKKKPSQLAFEPDPKTAAQRTNGRAETSINWADDENALHLTRSHQNSQHGVAELQTLKLRELEANKDIQGILSHERRVIENNPYHGNLLFSMTVTPKYRSMVANALALYSSVIIPSME